MSLRELVTDARALALRAESDAALTEAETSASPEDARSLASRRHGSHMTLGLLRWREGDVEGLRVHLQRAADAWLVLAESGGGRADLALASILATLAFGDPSQRSRAARLRPEVLGSDETQRRALVEVAGAVAGGELDGAAWAAIASGPHPDPVLSARLRPFASCMGGIARADETLASRALGTVLQHHAWMAHEGPYRGSVEGLLSFDACVLVLIARSRDVELAQVPYRSLFVPEPLPVVGSTAVPAAAAPVVDVLPARAPDAARAIASRISSSLGVDVASDHARMLRLENAFIETRADVEGGRASLQRLPFFVVVAGQPRGLSIRFAPDGTFEVAWLA